MPASAELPGRPGRQLAEPVAIVGMDVLLPGAAGLDNYWHNLVNGVDAISDVPPNRWEPDFYDPEHADQPNRIYCRRGGFVNELAYFDPMPYGVMPASVAETEPEQLLALRVAAGAIEDAGGADRLPDRDRVGVIFGRLGQSSMTGMKFYMRVMLADQMCNYMRELLPELSDDRLNLVRERITARLGPHHPESVIGLMPNLTASRVANRLNLRGPAYILDAACASSLIAVDHGIAELLAGRLDAVVVGGVHHNHDVTFRAVFSQLRALSRRQQIRPFDAAADGLLIGEGTGAVLLKRLSDAIRDGDRIHAVIRGIGVSSDGRSASLVNPETGGQLLAVRRAWASAGLDPAAPDSVGLLEAHGTGTPAGDATELTTIAAAFGPPGGSSAPVIGSVKSMIGHAMPAAGIASLVKTVLAVSKGTLLPTLHCDDPRPELARTRFMPIATSRPWDQAGPRRAAVNAFGFGGINVHVVVEQAPDAPASRRGARLPAGPDAAATVHEPDQIVLLAAPDAAALSRLLDADDHEVRAHGTALATSGAGSVPGGRLGIVDPTTDRLAAARKVVAAGAAWRGGRDIWFSPQPMLADGQGRIAYVFPGLEAELTHRVDDVAAHFGLSTAEVDEEDFSGHFVAVMGLGWLLHEALGRMGVTPDAVAGHSLGEWTAGLVAGVVDGSTLDESAALLFNPAWERKDLLHAVIGESAAAVTARLAEYPGVVLSHDNAPAQSVVCGPVEQVTRLIQEVSKESTLCRPLPFTTGVHTPYVQPLVDQMRPRVEQLRPHADQEVQAARVPVWSATIAAPFPADASQRLELFYRQLVEPVQFRSTLTAMHDAGFRAFLQVGPGQLASLIHDNLRGRDHLAISVNVAFRSGLAQLRRVATALWVEGYAPDLAALNPPVAQPKPARPARAARSMPLLLELGTERITLGEGADDLIDLPALAQKRARARAGSPAGTTAAGTTAGTTAGTVAAAGSAALDKLGHLAGSATAELAALMKDTADAAVAVLSHPGQAAGHGGRARQPGNGGGAGPALRAARPAGGGEPGRQPEGDEPGQEPAGGAEPIRKSVLRVSLQEMPYLIDHCFNPQPTGWPHVADLNPVVPATTIIQHMIDAVQAAAPGRPAVQVDDARFRSWVLVEPARDVDIYVKRTAPDEFSVAFGAYARATIRTAATYPDPPPAWRHDPATEGPSWLSPAEMYAKRIMFHGPVYRGVTAVHAVGKHHIRGLLRTPAPPGALLDSGLQLIGNWTHVTLQTRKVMFPTGFGSIRFFGPAPAEGDMIECVSRIPTVDERQMIGEIQYSAGGRVWAQIGDCVTRRFDSHPRSRAAETEPGHHAFAVPQPEGWVASFDYWPDPASQNSIVSLVLGSDGYAEYDAQPVVGRKGWLLSRLAVKDAVRHLLWDARPDREVFPIEISVSDAADGRPLVKGWAGLTLPPCEISSAQARHLAVAIARPAAPGAVPAAAGLGIGVREVGGPPKLTPPVALSDQELAVLEAAAAAEPGSGRDLWLARFGAARDAAARAQGAGPPGPLSVTAATSALITVTGSGQAYRLKHREIRNPGELPARRHVVAWT